MLDSFLEPVLDIIYCLFYFSYNWKTETANTELLTLNQPLLEYVPILVKLLTHSDNQGNWIDSDSIFTTIYYLVSEKACRCLSIIPVLYGDPLYEVIFNKSNLPHIINALNTASSVVQKHILKR